MSRYQVNKVLHEISMDKAKKEEFSKDGVRFLSGRGLTEEEREAILQRDYGILYSAGTHPFILWIWAERTRTEDPLTLLKKYTEAISPHGYPDFST